MTPSSNPSPLIEIKNLVKVYKTPAGDFSAVKGMNVEVQRGEFVAVIGKSGSGKSTFINMITGIDRPTSGEIIIDGAPVHSFSEAQMAAWRGKNLGIVFQFFQLFPTLTLLENVILPMELNKLYSKRERKERAMELLRMVEMEEQAHKLPSTISGGQQQRVAIARALANDPPLIVADEPTGNLDSKTAAKIFSLFEELVASGKTILMVTHDSDLASRVNRTILISDGEIVHEYLVRALATLNQDQLVEVARRVTPQVFPPDASIIRQGEVGDKFYILLDGKADVYVNGAGGSEVHVSQMVRGQYFGEMALLGNGVRAATVKASSDQPVSVAALDLEAFNKLVKESPVLREELTDLVEKRNIINQLQMISSFEPELLTRLLNDRKAIEFEPGQAIIQQGEVGDTIYLLLDGEVDVFVRHSDDTETSVDHLVKGTYFGEMAFLGNRRRQASARAAKNCHVKVMELTVQDFEEMMDASQAFKEHVDELSDERKKRIETGKRQKAGK